MGFDTRLPVWQAGDSVYLYMMTVIFILAALLALYALWERLTGNTLNSLYVGKSKIEEKGTAIPFEGNVFMNYWVLEKAKSTGKQSMETATNLLAAFLMKWIQEGRIEVAPGAKLRIGPEGSFEDSTEADLYKMFVDAGGEYHLLDSNSFAEWAKNHFSSLVPYPDRAQKHGRDLLFAQGYLDKDKFPLPEKYPEMSQVIELENFLKDIAQSGLTPERPWEDYLVTGVLLGCGDQMRSQISIQLPVELSAGLDAVVRIAMGYKEAVKREGLSNWDQYMFTSSND